LGRFFCVLLLGWQAAHIATPDFRLQPDALCLIEPHAALHDPTEPRQTGATASGMRARTKAAEASCWCKRQHDAFYVSVSQRADALPKPAAECICYAEPQWRTSPDLLSASSRCIASGMRACTMPG